MTGGLRPFVERELKNANTPNWFAQTKRTLAEANGKSRRLVYGEDGRHVYGGHIAPDGRYVLFTGNLQEDGDPGNAGAPMGLMRLSDAPMIGGESRELRALHPNTHDGPVLTLPVGWEPCWTSSELPGAPASLPASIDSPRGASETPGLPASSNEVARLATELRPRGWLVFSAKTMRGDDGESLRKRFPEARRGPRLDLGPGWEPCWTAVDLAQAASTSAPAETEAKTTRP